MKATGSFLKTHLVEGAILFGLLALIVGSCLFVTLSPRETATYADVTMQGQLLYHLDLQVHATKTIVTHEGDVVVDVKDKSVAIVSSPCPSQYCVRQGYKGKVGESIVCAHLGITITLVGSEVEEVSL